MLLDSDTEAEAAVTFVPEEYPEVATEGERSGDENDNDFSIITSSTEEERSSVDTMLDPEDLRPFQGECNISDARFRTKLGNVLAKYFHNDHLVGHAYLIDAIEQLKGESMR